MCQINFLKSAWPHGPECVSSECLVGCRKKFSNKKKKFLSKKKLKVCGLFVCVCVLERFNLIKAIMQQANSNKWTNFFFFLFFLACFAYLWMTLLYNGLEIFFFVVILRRTACGICFGRLNSIFLFYKTVDAFKCYQKFNVVLYPMIQDYLISLSIRVLSN